MLNSSITILNTCSRHDERRGAVVRFDKSSRTMTSTDTHDISFGSQPQNSDSSNLTTGDMVRIIGSKNNDGDYNVRDSSLTTLTVEEDLVDEEPGYKVILMHIGRIGKAHKAAGYYGYSHGKHTVQYNLAGYVGKIVMQATLSVNPGLKDWFNVKGTMVESTKENKIIHYTEENGKVGSYDLARPEPSVSLGYSFEGNFTYVRAKIYDFPTQDEIPAIQSYGAGAHDGPGSVSKVLLIY